MTQTYEHGFEHGMAAAVALGRAGASPDEIACLLDSDLGQVDPAAYQARLVELRKILQTDLLGAVGA